MTFAPSEVLKIVAVALNARLDASPRIYADFDSDVHAPSLFGLMSLGSSSVLIPGRNAYRHECDLRIVIPPMTIKKDEAMAVVSRVVNEFQALALEMSNYKITEAEKSAWLYAIIINGSAVGVSDSTCLEMSIPFSLFVQY